MPTTYAIPNGRTVMDATTYTGTGSALTVTNQAGFKPDLVWAQARSNANGYGTIEDTIRGVSKPLFSNFSNAEEAYVADFWITSFNSNGFSVGGQNQTGASGWTYVGWQWQAGQNTTTTNTTGTITSTVSANVTAGFSVVTYTGNEVQGATVGHGLGVAPSFILIKDRTSAQNWVGWQTTLGASNFLQLNANSAQSSSAPMFNGVAPSSTVITLAGGSQSDRYAVNKNSDNYVAYCWAAVVGFSAFGSYTGNGSSEGPFIYTGFRPKLLLYKRTDSAGSWFLVDSSRNPYNTANYWLQANTADAEQTDGAIDILSNGYKIRGTGTGTNANGGTYVYCAWAENPFKYANAR